MTWPTQAVSTANLDSGTDNPGLARADIKSAVDNINSVVAEFGSVDLALSSDGQVLTKTGGVWTAATPVVNTYGNTEVAAYLIDNPEPGTYGNTQVASYIPTYTGVVPVGKYTEAAYTSPTTSGTVVLDFANGNQQILNASGNITLGFVNAPPASTMTVVFNSGAASRAVTFANTARYAGNVRTVSTTTNTTDVIVVSTYDSGSNYLISIVKGFV